MIADMTTTTRHTEPFVLNGSGYLSDWTMVGILRSLKPPIRRTGDRRVLRSLGLLAYLRLRLAWGVWTGRIVKVSGPAVMADFTVDHGYAVAEECGRTSKAWPFEAWQAAQHASFVLDKLVTLLDEGDDDRVERCKQGGVSCLADWISGSHLPGVADVLRQMAAWASCSAERRALLLTGARWLDELGQAEIAAWAARERHAC
jgi:hypothetical protein